MQLINHDMDDLFRKAAKDYPLHTNTGDWDKVMQKMEQEQKDGQRNNGSRFRWLLLLLPLLFVCNRFVYVNRDASLPVQDRPETGGNDSQAQLPHKDRLHTTITHTITGSNQRLIEKVSKGGGNEMNASREGNSFIEKDGGEKNTAATGNKTRSFLKEMDNQPDVKGQASQFITGVQNTDLSSSAIVDGSGTDTDNKKNDTDNKKVEKPSETLSHEPPQSTSSILSDSLAKTTASGKKIKTKHEKGAYVGVIGGPDRSSVRSSKAKGVGYSAGLLAGYRFSKRIAVESGVYWDRKKYATNGKGFSTAQFNWLPHTNLLSIEGYCDMIEIPLVVRYNLVSTGSKSVFATAGASSYIMKKEDYQYDTERYGVYYSGKKTYRGSGTHLMTALHFSAGYEQSLGRSVKLRLEPYMKVPVAGIGVGNMSLKSTGILVGITRSIR